MEHKIRFSLLMVSGAANTGAIANGTIPHDMRKRRENEHSSCRLAHISHETEG